MAHFCRKAIFALTSARFVTTQAKTVQLIQSADHTPDRLADKGFLEIVPDYPFEGPTVEVTAITDQEMMGFGGALTESSALVFWALSEDARSRFLEMYYGESGLGYTFGRTHINSCDFSPDYYSFDEVDGDHDLLHFDSNVTHDQMVLMPFVRAVQEVVRKGGQELNLLVAPWSPPAWMKTNGKMRGSFDPGLKDASKVAWANYISKWIAAWKEHGIPIWALTPQNEPENGYQYGMWEECVYNPQEELDFIAGELGPVIQENHPEVKIYVFDHNKDHVRDWAEALQSHPQALQYATGIAFHWYTGDDFDTLADLHRRFPSMSMISSEATYDQERLHGAEIKDGNWDFAMGYAHDIIGDLNAGTAAWIDWNVVLDKNGGPNKVGNNCDAPVVSDGELLHLHPQYYAIGHFSKYIPPRSKRLEVSVSNLHLHETEDRPYGTCDGSDGLQATSFLRPDGIITVVVLNCGEEPIDFKLRDGGDAIQGTIPGRGIQTYLLDRSEDIVVA